MKIIIFKMKILNKKLFENLSSFWTENTGTIIKNKIDDVKF